MDLDKFKNRAQIVHAPDLTSADSPAPLRTAEDLIGSMKAVDAKDAALFRRMMLFVGISGLFCVLLFVLTWILPPDNDPGFHRSVLSIMGLLLLLNAYQHYRKYRMLSAIDYEAPLRSYLEEAERRYSFNRPRELAVPILFFIALILVSGAAWMSAFHRYFPSMDDSVGLLSFVSFFAAVLVVGSIIGVRDWKKRKAPLLKYVRQMKSELIREEREENGHA